MKRLHLLFAVFITVLLLNGCAIVQEPIVSYDKDSAVRVKDRYEIYQAVKNYPLLKSYYDEGVINIISVDKVKATYLSGYEYIIRYRYCTHYITNYSDRMRVLRENFPEMYNLYCEGKIMLDSVYAYVGKDGGVMYHVSYRQVNSGYRY